MLKVPVLLIAFNRPATTQQVLNAIALYQPTVLYVATDGARKNNESDEVKCKVVHELIDQWQINNPSVSIKKLYQQNNLGCGVGVSTAINWFFANEEMGIILEDDCLPNASFFIFCQTLLYQYKDDNRIMHIGGSNFIEPKMKVNNETYYFSIYPHIWGWASWRRAWSKYDFEMKRFEELVSLPEFRQYYNDEVFINTKNKSLDTWDAQWVYTMLINKGLSVLPYLSMVINLGYNENSGSHLSKVPKWYSEKVYELDNIISPEIIGQNSTLDKYVFNKVYKRGITYRLKKIIGKSIFKDS
ncbi:hypothetical protein [Ferruginibacter sp.]